MCAIHNRVLLSIALSCALILSRTQAQTSSVRVVFVGDIMLDGSPGHVNTGGGDPSSSVGARLRDADATLGNPECAILGLLCPRRPDGTSFMI